MHSQKPQPSPTPVKTDPIDKSGKSPLHIAIEKNETDTVKKLLAAKVDRNIQDNNGKSPLHIAIEKNDTYTIDLLLEAGVNVNLQDNDGNTPLHYAAKRLSPMMVDKLLEANADTTIKNKKIETALQIAKKISPPNADLEEDKNSLVKLLRSVNTTLITAIQNGQWDEVKKMAEKGVSFLPEDNNDCSPYFQIMSQFNKIQDPTERQDVANHLKSIFQEIPKHLNDQSKENLLKDLAQKYQTTDPTKSESFLNLLDKAPLLTRIDLYLFNKLKPSNEVMREFAVLAADERRVNIEWKEGLHHDEAAAGAYGIIQLFEKTHPLSEADKKEIKQIQDTLNVLNEQESFKDAKSKTHYVLNKWHTQHPKDISINYGFWDKDGGHAEIARIHQNTHNGKYHLTLYNAGGESITTDKNRLMVKGVREFEINLDKIALTPEEEKEIEEKTTDKAAQNQLKQEKKIECLIKMLVERRATHDDARRKELTEQIEQCCDKKNEIRNNQKRQQLRGNCGYYSLDILLEDRLSSTLYQRLHQIYSDPKEVENIIKLAGSSSPKLDVQSIPEKYKDNIYRFLREEKAKPDTLYNIGSHIGTLLHHAIRLGYDATASALLTSGAACKIFSGVQPAIILAIDLGKTKLVEQMIDKSTVQELEEVYDGKTPLIKAIHLGRWDIVKKLAEKGVSFSYQDNNNYVPYTEMLLQLLNTKDPATKLEIAKHLKSIFQEVPKHLQANSNLKLPEELFKHTSFKMKNEDILMNLTNEASFNLADLGLSSKQMRSLPSNILEAEKNKPLLIAVLEGDAIKVAALINEKKYDINMVNYQGKSLLFLAIEVAVKEKNMSVLTELLQADGLEINIKNKFGHTPLHFATNLGASIEVINSLLLSGADVTILNNYNQTALDIANNNQSLKHIAERLERASSELKEASEEISKPQDATGKILSSLFSELDLIEIKTQKTASPLPSLQDLSSLTIETTATNNKKQSPSLASDSTSEEKQKTDASHDEAETKSTFGIRRGSS